MKSKSERAKPAATAAGRLPIVLSTAASGVFNMTVVVTSGSALLQPSDCSNARHGADHDYELLPLIFATTTVLAVFAALRKAAAKEKAARAITGRLIPQLPTRRRFHCIAYLGGAAAARGDSGGPSSRGTLTGRTLRRPIPTTDVRLNLKIRPAIVTCD